LKILRKAAFLLRKINHLTDHEDYLLEEIGISAEKK